jgi:hypothetical protein
VAGASNVTFIIGTIAAITAARSRGIDPFKIDGPERESVTDCISL